MDLITLYHTTNEYNYFKIKEKGFIGLTKKDYEQIAFEILNFYNITDKKVIKRVYDILSNFDCPLIKDKEYIEMLNNGCVSFFPKLSSCERIESYGEHGGEHLGTGVKNALKSIARYLKITHLELPNRDYILKKYCGIGSKSIILKFKIPKELLCNNYLSKNYRAGYEINSLEKIPIKYLDKVIYFE